MCLTSIYFRSLGCFVNFFGFFFAFGGFYTYVRAEVRRAVMFAYLMSVVGSGFLLDSLNWIFRSRIWGVGFCSFLVRVVPIFCFYLAWTYLFSFGYRLLSPSPLMSSCRRERIGPFRIVWCKREWSIEEGTFWGFSSRNPYLSSWLHCRVRNRGGWNRLFGWVIYLFWSIFLTSPSRSSIHFLCWYMPVFGNILEWCLLSGFCWWGLLG